MKTRIYFFIRTLKDLIPAIWEATKYTNFDVGVFRCNDSESWLKYRELREKIAQIVEPTYKDQQTGKGHIHADLRQKM